MQAWKRFSPKIDFIAPTNYDEVLNTPLWWTTHFYGIYFGFSYEQASRLARKGMKFIRDIWYQATNEFLTWPALKDKFFVHNEVEASYHTMLRQFPQEWHQYLTHRFTFKA